jgi:cysteine-rich repeat protein
MEEANDNIIKKEEAKRGVRGLNAVMTLGLVVITAASATVWFVFASSLSNRRDIISNMVAGATAAHQISFNLSGGNTFAAGDQIAVDFPAGFSSGTGWAAGDFTFTDGTARTIVDVDSGAGTTTVDSCTAGANNIGVAVDTTGSVFRVIACPTFTASAAGAFITFTIDGVAPNGTLVNPAVVGSYVINVLDAGGDCTLPGDLCWMAVSIITDQTVTISATVPSVCGNNIVETGESCDDGNTVSGDGCSATCQTEGGGGGGPPPDTTPPTISGVACSDITKNSFKVNWTTSEAADSLTRYGLTTGYGLTSSDPNYVISHSASLLSLDEGATYHYQVCSKDSAGNNACSSDYTCTTLDETPPTISNVQVTNITWNTATVTWDTNEASSSYVDYDTDGLPYVSTSGAATPLVTSHSVNLTGLTPSTTYHFRVRSGDASANERFTDDATFVTLGPPDTTAPTISNIQITNITKDAATITWTTNEDSTSYVDYDINTGTPYASTSGAATPLTQSHSVNLTGLSENTTYYFVVRSADAAANSATSTELTFKTLDATAPTISNIQVTNITATAARVTWTTNESSDSTVEYGLTVAYGSTKTVGTMVTAHQVDLTGLTPNSTYNFRVLSKDASNNQATSGNGTFATPKPAVPVISNVAHTPLSQTSVRVTWDTTTASNSTVNYGLTTSYGTNQSDGTLVTSHNIVILNIQKNTTYHYRVRSTDAYAQEAVSGDYTFAGVPDNTPPNPPASLTATPGDSLVDLAWTDPAPMPSDFSKFVIRRSTSGYPATATDGDAVYDGALLTKQDTNVTNGVLYYYAAFACDDVGNCSTGTVASATPTGAPDTTPPANPNPFTATAGDGQVTLNWGLPADADYKGIRIYRKALSCPTGVGDGTLIYDGKDDTTKTDLGLNNGTLYCYKAFSYDDVPNYSSGAETSATPVAPPDTTPPASVTNFTATAGSAAIQLSWTNPADPDWAGTRVLRKTGGSPTGPTDGTIVFDGAGDSQLDSPLTNGTTYYYAAYAYDSAGNFAAPALVSATPQAALPPPPPPACSDGDGGKSYDIKATTTDNSGTYDDNCKSQTAVNEYYCDAGTAKLEEHDCGSGYKCSAGACVVETVQPPTSVCGNGICEAGENNINCLVDCPITPIAPPVAPEQPPELHLQKDDIRYLVTANRINLTRSADGTFNTFPNMTVIIYLPDASIVKPIKTAFINFRGSSYMMKETHSYEAAITTPSAFGVHSVQLVVNYDDGTSDMVDDSIKVINPGYVYESVGGTDRRLTGARASLYQDIGGGNFGLWNAAAYGQQNPATTNDRGEYYFIVPNGTYKLRAEFGGYRDKETMAFPVVNNLVALPLQLIEMPPPPVEEIKEIIASEAPVATKAAEVAKVAAVQTAYVAEVATEQVKEFVANPIVEQRVQTTAAPVVATVAVVNMAAVGAAAGTGIPYLMYLASLLAHPLLLFGRRKRKKWGTVYNSMSKMPVDLAIVRLLDARTDRVLRSSVTDKDGRFIFIVQAGEYKLAVAKAGYVYPTDYLKGQKEDGEKVDLYHGEVIKVKESSTIVVNIPVDPVTVEKTARRLNWTAAARRLQTAVAVLAILAMAVSAYIKPSPIIITLLVVNILVFLVFRRLAKGVKSRSWGIVYDAASNKPLRNALVRIFESKFNKLLETQVTDSKGRYSFLVGRNVYFVTYEKPGYQKQQKGPVDLVAKKEAEGVVAIDVKLEPEKKWQSEEIGKPPAPKLPPKGMPPTALPASTPMKPPEPPAIGSGGVTEKRRDGETKLAVEKPTPVAPAVPLVPPQTPAQTVPPHELHAAKLGAVITPKPASMDKWAERQRQIDSLKAELSGEEAGGVTEGQRDAETKPEVGPRQIFEQPVRPIEPEKPPVTVEPPKPPAQPAAPPPAAEAPPAPSAAPAAPEAKVPWELQLLKMAQVKPAVESGKAAGAEVGKSGSREVGKVEGGRLEVEAGGGVPPVEPPKAVPDKPPVIGSGGAAERQRGGETESAVEKPIPVAPTVSPTAPTQTPAPLAPPAATITPSVSLLPDVEHAHPEIKLLDENPHPDENKGGIKPVDK